MIESLAYLNGQFLPQSQACLALNDAGFVFGAAVTDMCRTFYHKLFRLADHLTRFRHSCERACIQQPKSDEELAQIAERLVAENAKTMLADQDVALVMFATPGPIGYYLGEAGGPGDGPPTLGMHTFPLPCARFAKLFTEGARLIIPSVRHVPGVCVDRSIKQRSRLHWWLAEQEVRGIDPSASPLLLDLEGHVTETSSANFLLVRKGMVQVPKRSSVLGGISLLTVEELCNKLGIPFEERPLTAEDCLNAEEAMLASTPYCLAGVSRINDTAIPWPGSVFEALLAAWSDLVKLDIRKQIVVRR